jgi:hypothetical protein
MLVQSRVGWQAARGNAWTEVLWPYLIAHLPTGTYRLKPSANVYLGVGLTAKMAGSGGIGCL